MHLLPINLAPVADIASKHSGKYATDAIDLRFDGSTYHVASTDGKRLLYVTGPCPRDGDYGPTTFPESSPIHTAPNGKVASLVPGPEWKQTFRDAAKAVANRKAKTLPVVAVSIGEKVTTFATASGADRANDTVCQHENVDSRFPPYLEVLPKRSPIVAQRIDPKLLGDLLAAVRSFTNEAESGIDLEVHKNGHVVLRAVNGEQQTVGLCVGLGEPKAATVAPKDDEQTADRLRDKVADLETELSGCRDRIRELQNGKRGTTDETSGAKVKRLRAELAEAKQRSEDRLADLCKANERIESMLRVGDSPAPTTGSEVESLRRQVAVLQAINARLVSEKGMVEN